MIKLKPFSMAHTEVFFFRLSRFLLTHTVCRSKNISIEINLLLRSLEGGGGGDGMATKPKKKLHLQTPTSRKQKQTAENFCLFPSLWSNIYICMELDRRANTARRQNLQNKT
jgi:hypothetical protein